MSPIRKIASLFPVRIVVGVVLMVLSVLLAESPVRQLVSRFHLPADIENLVIAIKESALALIAYIFFYRFAESRKITELKAGSFPSLSAAGFAAGIVIQAIIVLTLFMTGQYRVEKINPLSYLLPGLSSSLAAGFIGELVFRGIFFRIVEEKLGTWATLVLMVVIFSIAHAGAPGANLITVSATSVYAGLLISAVYVYSRSLWPPIFLHFGYDFAEPGIFGGINPGIHIDKTLLNSVIGGNALISGGDAGPQNSLPGLIIYLLLSFLFLSGARKRNRIVNPFWLKKPGHE